MNLYQKWRGREGVGWGGVVDISELKSFSNVKESLPNVTWVMRSQHRIMSLFVNEYGWPLLCSSALMFDKVTWITALILEFGL